MRPSTLYLYKQRLGRNIDMKPSYDFLDVDLVRMDHFKNNNTSKYLVLTLVMYVFGQVMFVSLFP